MESKKLLDSFVAYCEAHPEQRFWQSLRNWSNYNAIYGLKPGSPLDVEDALSRHPDNKRKFHLADTFYLK